MPPRDTCAVFDDVLLIIFYSGPHYASIPLLRRMYGAAFPHIMFFSRQGSEAHGVHGCWVEDPTLVVRSDIRGMQFVYRCVSLAAHRYANYSGYLFMHDDVLLPFWNLRHLPRDHAWQSVRRKHARVDSWVNDAGWDWWDDPYVGRAAARRAFDELPDTGSSWCGFLQ